MKVSSYEEIGDEDTYTLEIDHESHNYVVDLDDGYYVNSANSHATSYILLTYRSLFLKAHFPNEWWAAVMSGCHREKLPKFIATAKAEGVQFGNIDANSLAPTFTVVGNTISPGITSIKGVGAKLVNKIAVTDSRYDTIDDFVEKNGKCRVLVEAIIKMGGFSHQHTNKKALWMWYTYKHNGDTKFKNAIRRCFAWPKSEIEKERTRQADEFRALYPKRSKLPTKITNWVPTIPWETIQEFDPDIEISPDDAKLNAKINIEFDHICMLFKDDFSLSEILAYEKQVLGYFWHSPLDAFIHNQTNNIKAAKSGNQVLECVIESVQFRKTAKSEFVKLTVTDGVDKANVMVWSSDIELSGLEVLQEDVGVRMVVKWGAEYRSFNIVAGNPITPLQRK